MDRALRLGRRQELLGLKSQQTSGYQMSGIEL
jgi:hypothetical protein